MSDKNDSFVPENAEINLMPADSAAKRLTWLAVEFLPVGSDIPRFVR